MGKEKIYIKKLGLQFVGKAKRKKQACLVECPNCHKQRTIFESNFKIYKTTKCNTCKNLKHGDTYTKLYKIYGAMLDRCYNTKNHAYERYGERGIKICEEWKNSYLVFKEWAYTNGYMNNLSIDRIDNDGNYTPNNCRWATRTTQMRNTRRIHKHNTSGYRGVYSDKRVINKWYARIVVNKKTISLGGHNTKREAAEAFNNYVIENNLEHTQNIIKD